MKSLLLFVPYLILPYVNAQQLPHTPKRYFDFWIGKWEATWDEGEGKTGKGTNQIEWILDDKVIQEHFEIVEGQSKGFKGTSISVYRSKQQEWRQAWADNQGGYYDFIGSVDGSKRIFQTQAIKQSDGQYLIQRMVFYNIEENTMIWDWESSLDQGKTWTLLWRIHYERIEE